MTTDQRPPQPGFAPTRWSLVERARGDSDEGRAALSDLCGAYWEPVFRALRHQGHPEELARERAQEFFAWILAGNRISGADPARGRFRSYLLGALRHFLADQRERDNRQKRAGRHSDESLDDPNAQELPDPVGQTPDEQFDRDWGLTVMARALDAVGREYAAGGRERQFEALKPWLAGGATPTSQAALAADLGLQEGAVKVAIHRVRHRFREAVRKEIRETLGTGGEVEEELRYLVDVLVRVAGGPHPSRG